MPRIALLVSGSLHESIAATHGQYPRVFHRFLQDSLPPHAPSTHFTLEPYDVVHKMEYPSEEQLDGYDALMYTGSAANAYEDIEWINRLVAFTARVLRERPRLRIIGICFGHQIISRALGGSCVPNNGVWEVGPTPLDLTDLGKQLFGVDSLNIQQMHRDHVPSLPPSPSPDEALHLLGSTSTSPIQGYITFFPSSQSQSLANTHIITVQGHPEFTEPIVSGIVAMRAAAGIISPEVVADAERRRWWQNDGVGVLGKAVWAVLGVV
ncbi:hypothetical protein H0H87_007587 [Tephrocybe sp. NHM501043]|nr:hypothetical protein H0H87_007587 [Tephrocybe sp. NHM501043]